ncbi:MAG TPA: hypothetical protein VM240_04785 [Verrucomicrobiae bacterium]|nr:hypothetical protein [Verrucomicrobiae bacterium]
MNRLYRLRGLLVPVIGAIAACGDGDNNTLSGCLESFASKDAIALSLTSSPACSVHDAFLSVDGERESYASLEFPAGGCVQDFGATLFDPDQFSGGNVGVFVALPASLAPNVQVTLKTWLDGSLQDSSLNHGGTLVTTTDQAEGKYYSFPTDLPFDEVNLEIGASGSATGGTVRVYEFCANR